MHSFHPAVAAWFESTFDTPTPAQQQAWPAIQSGRHALIAAPTGSGKTLAAFLAAIDALVRRGVEGALTDETHVVYVSPLKALSNDIRINLESPLAGIREELQRLGLPDVEIRAAVRTGDTPQAERNAMRKRAPHIVVTTPESLYILLGSESGRRMLGTTRTVIVDEIHALAPNKRGSHLALSLERLDALCGQKVTRIGLSATQKPIQEVARFLCASQDCAIVDVGYSRARDLGIEVTGVPLQAVMSNDAWELSYNRLTELIQGHRTTLIFVNTRRMVERATRHLAERLGKDAVAAHHGSLSKEKRLDAEQRLKSGQLRALVATASLELGIDIGEVDLVCQLGSPRSIAAWLQRAGRAGHAVGGTSKARLFPSSRDDLAECAALLDCVRRGELDTLKIPRAPLDVLAQQIVAEVACGECDESALSEMLRGAYPYAALDCDTFTEVLRMLADGYSTRRGTRSAYLHRDAVNGKLRARRGARLTAITSGGAIPDTADYDVVLEPQSLRVGSLNEDFAVESLAGDIFQLGNMSYRILRVERGRVRVEDAHGAPPSIPFWLGEAPGRSDELSRGVARLREEIAVRLNDEPLSQREKGRGEGPVSTQTSIHGACSSRHPASSSVAARDAIQGIASAQQLRPSSGASRHLLPEGEGRAIAWLRDEVGVVDSAAKQLVEYYRIARIELGLLPTQDKLAMERFFDESGGTQLVIHSPFGSRINRAWGLALRKRFCRKFNFELQAAATEDAIVLSLSTSHSFPLEEVVRYLHSNSVREVLTQALLDAPMFAARWRWNASAALALPRFVGGAKVPPQIQRMKSEDLLATVFPDQVACAENLTGERQIPDHPLVAQTLHDCLHEAMDIDGLVALLQKLEQGEARIVARDLTAPSSLAAEVLGAQPYAYLDDAPLEERRTQAVASRGFSEVRGAEDLGKLDADAIAAVREEAWPSPRDADEMHETLLSLGAVNVDEVKHNASWEVWLHDLARANRATRLILSPTSLWVAAEMLPVWRAIHPAAGLQPSIDAPAEFAARAWIREDALTEIVRARMGCYGPVHSDQVAAALTLPRGDVDLALTALEREGFAMRGRFSLRDVTDAAAQSDEWCERHLLARIHRRTVQRLRREIEPVEPRDFMRFLFDWQHVAPGARLRGAEALAGVLAQLEGYEAPAAAWESQLLPARLEHYDIGWLDGLCSAGRIAWTRLRTASSEHASPVHASPIVLLPRRQLSSWSALGTKAHPEPAMLSSRAQAVVEFLSQHGASFFDEIAAGTRLLRVELENVLAEMVGAGLVNADSFSGLRALLQPSSKRNGARHRRVSRHMLSGIEDAGRWSLIKRDAARTPEAVEHIARTLLRRYGVIFWKLLVREASWLPPWREILRLCQRLEARGEIRGGRFVAGVIGEQFALPEAVGAVRAVRRAPHDSVLIRISGTDPLNLIGSVLPGAKVPAVTGSRIVFRDGVPLATRVAGEITPLQELSNDDERAVRGLLSQGYAQRRSTEDVA
ncbi:MAG: DEAD/DEAH box helicase [Rhodanobacteraceae bacterium]